MSSNCSICLENIENMYITECCHKFCKECFENWRKTCKDQNNNIKCPVCRTLLEEVIIPKESNLLLFIENIVNYDINYMYDEEEEDIDSEDENSISDFEVEDNDEEKVEKMPFYKVRIIQNYRDEDDEDDEEYHINRTRELENELYGFSYTYN